MRFDDPGRIQLNSLDLKMIRNSFDEGIVGNNMESVGDLSKFNGDRMNTISSSQNEDMNNVNDVDMTYYANNARGFPEILNSNSLHVTKSGTMGLKVDIGIKNGENFSNIDNHVIRVGGSRLNGGKTRLHSTYLKGVLMEMGSKPTVSFNRKNKESRARMSQAIERGHSLDYATGNIDR